MTRADPPKVPIPPKSKREFKRSPMSKRTPRSRNGTREGKHTPIKSITDDHILVAVGSLLNNRKRLTSESKIVQFDENILKLARGLFRFNKAYPFKLVTTNSISASSGGVVNGYIDFPTVAVSTLEWAALSALFQFVRMHSFHMQLVTATAPPSILVTAGPIPITMVIAHNVSDDFSAVTLNEIIRFDHKLQFQGYLGSNGAGTTNFSGRTISCAYAEVKDVGVISPPSGVVGGINYCSYAVGTNSAVYFDYYLNMVVSFKARQ